MNAEELQLLEERIGHHFTQPAWLEQALTHRSARPSSPETFLPDNERMEFLGDRVLGLVVSQHLYETFSDWAVGSLSKGHSRLVSASSIEEAARGLSLGAHLRLGRGEELTGGRDKRNLLADAYEAVIAAIYLDSGLQPAADFIRRTLLDSEAGGERSAWSEPDHKSALQEWLQQRGLGIPQYRVVGESGPDHSKIFSIQLCLQDAPVASSEGRSKKEAEQAAARMALLRLRKEESARFPAET
jgi:ribonuclease-3